MSRKLVLGLLIMFALVVSSFTYAYWINFTVVQDAGVSGTISIGDGDVVLTVNAGGPASNTGLLVPVGYADLTADPVENSALELLFNVNWTSDRTIGDAATGTLVVTITAVEIDPSDPLADNVALTLASGLWDGMFTITVTGDGAITEGVEQPVTITVTFTNEPAKTIYDLVANGQLLLTITFNVTGATEAA
ncbi:MAG: hypothetical protein ACNA7K_05055 [Acholeplasmataceae bacterium]